MTVSVVELPTAARRAQAAAAGAGLTAHKLRRTFASVLVMIGEEPRRLGRGRRQGIRLAVDQLRRYSRGEPLLNMVEGP